MKFGWFISVFLHGIVAFGSLFALSKASDLNQDTRIVPVKLLDLDEFTNIKAAIKTPKPDTPTPQEPMQLETPAEYSETQDEAQERSVTDTPPAPPADTPDAEKVAEALPPKPPAFDLESMSALVDKAREAQPEINQQITTQSERNFYEYAEASRAGAGLGTDLTMSELDALQTAMYKCWRIPLDAKNPEELIIRVNVALRSDGHVQSVDLLDKAAIARAPNPFMSVAAQRAVNAVSKCAPYDFLPLDKYDRWKNMTLRFKPEL